MLAGPPRNEFLNGLPPEELDRLLPRLSRVQLVSGQVLYECGARVEQAYFIESGMASMVSSTGEDQLGAEVGIIGREGLAGCWALFDASAQAFCRTVVQMPGTALRISAANLPQVATEFPALRRIGFHYLQALMAQTVQSSACSALHPLQKRVARWLLNAHDRADGDELQLTQEVLSNMLGVRRPGVTIAAGALQDAGLIAYSRGHLKIIDRAGLERAACSCYGAVRDEYDRLLKPALACDIPVALWPESSSPARSDFAR